ncbi:Carboxyl-terminal protease [Anaerovibrio sp. JC8]|uniref:S41 family peptidase n=1 Tax=Anaerovibrio sp. JC8 TaxID=1240085 RepID=UPI000A0C9176|nr:S41 family peptidase [Anaerovibrio sp. JC8]ORU00486.1 Carboxyl-terminal protease [Anaerovibrio sp. JC8]
MSQTKKSVLLVVGTALVTLLAVCCVIFYMLGGTVGKAGDMLRFIATVNFVEDKYDGDVDRTVLINGSIDGMMKSLGDKYSIYLDEEKFRQLSNINSGTFGGIGVVMSFAEPGHCHIMSVMENTPGQEAGLQAGDEVIAVEGTPVSELQPEEVVGKIRGVEGTQVVITIRRQGEADKDYTLTRSSIAMTTAAGNMIPDTEIGYIRIASFSENTGREFTEALDKLKEQNAKGLIIDLRANPGGLVNSCMEIANQVVPEGEVVSLIDNTGSKQVFTSSLTGPSMPIVVLIDGNSASASEILAGALKDRGAATLVGMKSYGKGSVQTILPLFRGDGIKLTVAKYYTPSGASIDGIGIQPDVEIALPEHPTEDVQLLKAVEVMKEKLQ